MERFLLRGSNLKKETFGFVLSGISLPPFGTQYGIIQEEELYTQSPPQNQLQRNGSALRRTTGQEKRDTSR